MLATTTREAGVPFRPRARMIDRCHNTTTILFEIKDSWYQELHQVWHSGHAYVLMLMSPVFSLAYAYAYVLVKTSHV